MAYSLYSPARTSSIVSILTARNGRLRIATFAERVVGDSQRLVASTPAIFSNAAKGRRATKTDGLNPPQSP
jgi:hypothetical protein